MGSVPQVILKLIPGVGDKTALDVIQTVSKDAGADLLRCQSLKDPLNALSETAHDALGRVKTEAETDRRDRGDMAEISEAKSCFVVVMQGIRPWAGVVEGIEGIREALTRIVSSDPEQLLFHEVAAAIASLDDPEAWAVHGLGDGRPFWHWWLGYDGGSVTLQRLTEPLPPDTAMCRLRSTLNEVAGVLADISGDLRRLTDAEQKHYLFMRRQP